MVSGERLYQLEGSLLIVSAITHSLQVIVYGGIWHNIGAALYGLMYLFLGIGLIRYPHNRLVLPLSITLPGIGGIGGVIRFLFLHTHVANYFIVLHVAIDIVVVPTCAYLYRNRRREPEPVRVPEQPIAAVQE